MSELEGKGKGAVVTLYEVTYRNVPEREKHENFRHHSRGPDRDLNPKPSEHVTRDIKTKWVTSGP
jgi:hypothetical protein